ncbi:unnamed protein product [Prorocentrum cordatum]|uniref:Uncharacterized protein n=1 Tax=Prorocentrum cordatum TaxID=2364126 RepID=A0ABN9RSQ2_9DINO|nr:unnamed protein product [Polarella glacialis]
MRHGQHTSKLHEPASVHLATTSRQKKTAVLASVQFRRAPRAFAGARLANGCAVNCCWENEEEEAHPFTNPGPYPAAKALPDLARPPTRGPESAKNSSPRVDSGGAAAAEAWPGGRARGECHSMGPRLVAVLLALEQELHAWHNETG